MLIDTHVWIDWIQGRENDATRLLDSQLDEGEAWLAPVILQELLQGARSERELERLQQEFIDQPMLTASTNTYALAGNLYARCRWRGITVRSAHDCLIAATALEHGAPLLSGDRDFEAIRKVEPGLVLVNP